MKVVVGCSIVQLSSKISNKLDSLKLQITQYQITMNISKMIKYYWFCLDVVTFKILVFYHVTLNIFSNFWKKSKILPSICLYFSYSVIAPHFHINCDFWMKKVLNSTKILMIRSTMQIDLHLWNTLWNRLYERGFMKVHFTSF